MTTRKNAEFSKQIFYDRLDDAYVYGGTFDPNNVKVGADCSGLVTDELGALFFGTSMHWDREGLSTESYRYKPLGPQNVGPFALVHVASWQDIPADAAAKISLHHEGQGGPQSHMNVCIDGLYMEESSDHGVCTTPQAMTVDNPYWNDWWFVPGPITEDGTPIVTGPNANAEPKDTLFADVSEFQVHVDDSYPYQVLSIRVCDGTYQDKNFAENYAWMKAALDSGKLKMGIVYVYVRPDWQATANTVHNMIGDNGGLHPKVVLMLDVESGGNPAGDASQWIDALYASMALLTGDSRRVIGYGNVGDLNSMWISKPNGVRLIVASYGSNPSYPGEIAHQYTDGQGFGGGLPEGCPPFGTCDMNSADGLSPSQFAAVCGIATTIPPTTTTGELSMADVQAILDKLDHLEKKFDGADAATPDAWRLVHLLRDAVPGDLATGDTAEMPNDSASEFDQIVTLAKILTRRFNHDGVSYDLWDMVTLLFEAAKTTPVVTPAVAPVAPPVAPTPVVTPVVVEPVPAVVPTPPVAPTPPVTPAATPITKPPGFVEAIAALYEAFKNSGAK